MPADSEETSKYLYNGGVEKNDLTGYYETFYRQYDASIGRFTGIDIKAAKYSSISPYQYALNDPISLNDPAGDDPHSDWYESRGSWYDQKDQYAPMRWRGYPVFKPQTTRSGIEQIMEWNAMASNYYSDLQAWVDWNHFLSGGSPSSGTLSGGEIVAFLSTPSESPSGRRGS